MLVEPIYVGCTSFLGTFVRSFRFLWSTMTICRCFMFARHIFRSAFFFILHRSVSYLQLHWQWDTFTYIRCRQFGTVDCELFRKIKKKKHRKILVIIDINLELYSLCSTPSEQRAAAAAAATAATASSSSFRIMASQKCFRNAWICQCGKLAHIHHPWICWTF